MSDAVFSASFVRFSMLVDGSIRAVIDIDPSERAKCLAILDKPGVPLVVARLTNQAAVEHDRSRMAETPGASEPGQGEAVPASGTLGASRPAAASPDPLPAHKLPSPLPSRVAMTCNERTFSNFLRSFDPDGFGAVEQSGCDEPVKQYVRDWCGVPSRKDIRPDTAAAARWETLRAEYEFWQRQGRAA